LRNSQLVGLTEAAASLLDAYRPQPAVWTHPDGGPEDAVHVGRTDRQLGGHAVRVPGLVETAHHRVIQAGKAVRVFRAPRRVRELVPAGAEEFLHQLSHEAVDRGGGGNARLVQFIEHRAKQALDPAPITR